MTAAEQFLTMRLVASRVGTDFDGDLVRTETRRCDRTGLTLTRTAYVAPSDEYLAAIGTTQSSPASGI